MHFVRSWTTEDMRTLLYFSESTLETFTKHTQSMDSDREAGGLLLGTVHGSHMFIEQATVPTARDKRLRFLFERMPFGHEAVALAQWAASNGRVRYLGEWHTHPEDHPRPSDLDRSEWIRLAARRLDKRPLLSVVVGRQDLYVGLVLSSGQGPVLQPKE